MSVEKNGKKWTARYVVDGKRKSLGTFKTKREATEAVEQAKAIAKADKEWLEEMARAEANMVNDDSLLDPEPAGNIFKRIKRSLGL